MIKKDSRLVKRFWFQMYEGSRVEKFLTDMAEKGWMLERFEGNKFIFQPCLSLKIRFSVNIFDDSLGYKSYKEAKRSYLEFCEKAGWNFIGNHQKIYIFYTKDYNVIPIETEDELTLSIINKNILRENCYNWFFAPILLSILSRILFNNFGELITQYLNIGLLVTWVCIVFNGIFGMFSYVFWYFSSKKRIQSGKELKSYDGKNRSTLMMINLQFGRLLFALISIAGILTGDIVLLIIMTVFLMCILYSVYESKKEVLSRRVRRNVILAIMVLIITVVGLGIIKSIQYGYEFSTRNEILLCGEDGGLTFAIINHHEIPVTLEEYGILMGNDSSISKETTENISETVFAQSYSYSDYYMTKQQEHLKGFNYEVFQSDFQWIINKYLKDEWINTKSDFELIEEDPALFRADKLYVSNFDNGKGYRYIAVYEKKILILEVDEVPTSKQIELFLNKLELFRDM